MGDLSILPSQPFAPPPPDGQVGASAAGIVLHGADIAAFLAARPGIGWVEAHAENFMGRVGAVRALALVRRDFQLSLHSVGLSLGSPGGPCPKHLRQLAALRAELQPALVSDHLAWSSTGGRFLNALLPIPYTEEALEIVCRNIETVQNALGQRLLVENIAAYVRLRRSEIPEPEFLMELVRRTGCAILCDINNVFVNSVNFGTDPCNFINALSPVSVHEIHVGGHARVRWGDQWVLFDEHSTPVDDTVWELYRQAICLFGARPTLIERDVNSLPLHDLVDEARRAGAIMTELRGLR